MMVRNFVLPPALQRALKSGVWTERVVIGEINPPESQKKLLIDWESCKQRFIIGEVAAGVEKA